MEDYDIELIDYLSTLWWGKWIIIGCLVAAVGVSWLFVGLQPTMYSSSTEILLREYVTAALAGDRNATIAKTSAVEFTLTAVKGAVPGIAGSLADDRITLSRRNAASADVVGEDLAQAKEVLEQQLPVSLANELEHLSRVTQFHHANLAAQLKIMRQRLSAEQNTAETTVSESLAVRIAELEAQLSLHQVRLDILETAEPEDLFALIPIADRPIMASESNLNTTVAVAGLLGLMVGTLITFLVNYLLQVGALCSGKKNKLRHIKDG